MNILFSSERDANARVAVLISLYNYEQYICEALDSIAAQSLEHIELIVCNDCSTDNGAAVAGRWMDENRDRFSRLALIENKVNSGLSATRNAAVAHATAPYVFILDADNMIYPACLERSLEILEESGPDAAFVYTLREMFDEADPRGAALENLQDWDPALFSKGNYIDAMALHKKRHLESVGGYTADACFGRLGWEDYELWLKYIRAGYHGIKIHQPLIRYRHHADSMLRTTTGALKNRQILWEALCGKYPGLVSREPLLQSRLMNKAARFGLTENFLRRAEAFLRQRPALFRLVRACKNIVLRLLA